MEVETSAQGVEFSHNLAILRTVSPELAQQVENLPADRAISLLPAGQSAWTAKVRCEDGAEVLLASGHDPRREAKRWCDSLEIAEDKHAVVVVGCGLGYHVAELLSRRRGGLVVVLEPSLAVLHAALRCNDFFKDLAVRRLVFVVAGQRSDLFAPLAPHNVELMLGTLLTQHPTSGRIWPKACSEMHSTFTEYLYFVRCALATTLKISAISCDNVLHNLPHYLRWPGIEPLKDSCKGLPGFCVAAGPSLQKNIHHLKRIKGKAPIITVQTVLQPLLKLGIHPDFITALDFSPRSSLFYEGLDELKDVTLVADAKVHHVVPECFPGPVRVFRNQFASTVLDELKEDRDALNSGSTVAHLNFYLARYLGCDPIVLVGQDLAFGENLYYSPGNPIHQRWSPELNRFNTLEMKEWARIVNFGSQLRKVPGQNGKMIYTDPQMFTYIQQFERDIATTPAAVLNATEGGAHIANTKEVPLADVIALSVEKLPPLELPKPQLRPDAAQRVQAGIDCLRRRLAELDQLDEVCRQILKPLRKMPDAVDDPKKFNQLHARMDRWRVKIDSLMRIYKLVADMMQIAEMRRMQLDHALHRKKLDEVGERREQLSRDIQYISLLQQGITILRGSMNKALERLEGLES